MRLRCQAQLWRRLSHTLFHQDAVPLSLQLRKAMNTLDRNFSKVTFTLAKRFHWKAYGLDDSCKIFRGWAHVPRT
jgi:hypothetical protein